MVYGLFTLYHRAVTIYWTINIYHKSSPGNITILIEIAMPNSIGNSLFTLTKVSIVVFLFYPPTLNSICFVEKNNIFLRFCLCIFESDTAKVIVLSRFL